MRIIKWKQYWLLVFLFWGNTALAQHIDDLVRNASLQQDYSSVIEFGEHSKITKKQLENWIEKNAISYVGHSENPFTSLLGAVETLLSNAFDFGNTSSSQIVKGFIQTEYTTRFMYGAHHTFASKLIFVKASQFRAYASFWEKQEQLARERQEQDKLIGTGLAILGGYLLYKGGEAVVKGVGKMLDTDVKSDTRRDAVTAPFYDLISKSNNISFNITKYDISNQYVNISIGCDDYKHELDKQNDGFYASFASEKYKNDKKESYTDYRVLDKSEIDFGTAPGLLYVSYQTKDSKNVFLTIRIKEPGYYRVTIDPY